MHDVTDKLREYGIVPVVTLDDEAHAVPVARALVDAGLPCLEITYRTRVAEAAIRRVAEEFPGILVGAGTVRDPEQAAGAVDAGADFIVSPSCSPAVAAWCLEHRVHYLPGANDPAGIEAALAAGTRLVKFFPAAASGGLAMLAALADVYREVRFVPTGGIEQSSLVPWLAHLSVVAVGGSWMIPPEAVACGRYGEVERLARAAVDTMLGFAPSRLLVPEGSLGTLGELPGLASLFAPGGDEKPVYEIATRSLPRAVAWLRRRQVQVMDEDGGTAARLVTGSKTVIVRLVARDAAREGR